MSLAPRGLAVTAAALLGILAVSPASAETRELFRTPTPSETQAVAEPDSNRPGETRRRLVALNSEAFGASAAARGDGGRPSLRIRLFPGAEAVFEQTDEEPADDGDLVWNGASADGASATLVISDDRVTGRVRLGGRIYRISPARRGVHHITEIDRAALPPVGPEIIAPTGASRDARSAAPNAAAAEGDTEITALFAYTANAKKNAEDIRSKIKLAVALTNRAYKASGVRIRLKLVGTIMVKGYDESKRTYGEVLTDLRRQERRGAPFAAVGKRRDELGADLVALVREGGAYCGLAYVVPEPGKSEIDADYGYSEISRDCIEIDVTAHELGHNMGLLHDRYVEEQSEGKAPKSQYNFGYVNVAKKVRDIMSYSDKCDAKGVNCEAVSKFSSADDTVKGQPFGVPKGRKGAADAVRRLNETREGVASYRSDK